jgi:hypothetical protein
MTTSTFSRLAFALAVGAAFCGETFAQVTANFNVSDQGFTSSLATGNATAQFSYSSTGGLGGTGAWTTPGFDSSLTRITSPVYIVQSLSEVTGSMTHRFNFEQGNGSNYDGGVIQFSINGGAFQNIGITLVGGTGYAGPLGGVGPNPIGTPDGFGGTSPNYSTAYTTSTFRVGTTSAQTLAPGTQIQFAFTAGWDDLVINAAPNWDISSATFNNVQPIPEPATIGLGVFAFAFGSRLLRRRIGR